MTKKIAVNGREISVKEEDFEYLVEQFKEGVQIDDLERWQSTVRICTQFFHNSQFQVTHEPYDFSKFIEKAKEYSDKSSPDVVQFSEKAWGAAAIFVKEFFLKRFSILIKSHLAKSYLLNAICTGLNGKQTCKVKDAWSKAEK